MYSRVTKCYKQFPKRDKSTKDDTYFTQTRKKLSSLFQVIFTRLAYSVLNPSSKKSPDSYPQICHTLYTSYPQKPRNQFQWQAISERDNLANIGSGTATSTATGTNACP
jgi:hypothetical protein